MYDVGQKCTDDSSTGNDIEIDKGTQQRAKDLYSLLFKSDFECPEDVERVLSKITFRKPDSILLPPMRALIYRLADSYHRKHDCRQELRYLLLLSCVYDPVFFPNPTHPDPVENLHRLVLLLQQIAFAKKSSGALSEIPFERHEIGLVYKYNMLKIAEAALVSHGRESTLARATRIKLLEEAKLMNPDGEAILHIMKSAQMQTSMRQLQSNMVRWAGISEEEAVY